MTGRPPVTWWPEMDDELRRMRALGHGYERCGRRIGVSNVVVHRRVKELGMPVWAQPWMLGAVPSHAVSRQRVAALIEEMAQ